MYSAITPGNYCFTQKPECYTTFIMHGLSEFLTIIITGYLAFTTGLATHLEGFFALTTPLVPTEEPTTTPVSPLQSLPSLLGQTVPTILLQNAEYQAAAIAGSAGLVGATTREPLDAIVNIFCTFTTDEYIRTTTGTGFFIDPDGIIMTNAHVAQFLLFEETHKDGETKCVIRTGNPAAPAYHAELLYLPPTWVRENASVLTQEVPMGTGERDYALLYVNATVDDSPLPAVFPALGFDTNLLPITARNNPVLAAGYPATALFLNGASADLIPQRATTSISELYTFGSNYADVFSIRGSNVGREGSSGGPILNAAGAVIGIIVTRGDDSIDGDGSLRAITISHIDRTIQQETNFSLAQNLNGNLAYRADIFSKTLTPFLLTLLEFAN